MKKLFAVILTLTLVLTCFAGCGAKQAGSDLEYIRNKGRLVVGITEYAPMDYKDADGSWIGFDADLANLVGKELGVQVEFLVLADWGQKFYELETKNIDCIWNGMTITEEAARNSSVTDPYAINAQVVVMPADKAMAYADIESIQNLTIAVESGSAGESALQNLEISNLVAVQDQPAAVMEVAAGTADACVIDITMANAMTGAGTGYDNLTIAQRLTEEQYGISFRKDSDVTAEVNKLIAQFRADGTLSQLSEIYGVAAAD